MSRMSGPDGSSAVPFILRRKQSLTRYSIVSTTPLRARYCGYRANTPTHEPVSRRPASRWQLVQRNLLPTWLGKLSRVVVSSARPRRTASPYGPAGMVESAATAAREGAGFEQPPRAVMPSKTVRVLGRTRRDNTGISEGGNLLCGAPIQTRVSSTQEDYDCAAARFPAARRPKPLRSRFRNRHAGPQSTANQRFRSVRARRSGAHQLRGVLGARVRRSRHVDASADADTDADARRWWGRVPRRHA